eukprot:CAMPEP_0174878262 /NCGR_PEP_ID=MMETSP1114-20130205/82671_1 /TAXON_ID=312471 /ORGANISM="Neobodo designis, Strain CCAP 1951/1" /LENGTH=578 /DNA_ID=CAMNT_0016113649 /DNA_START=130 /DNA_END=1866 /DNA_ORIENTATION=+
MVKRNDRLEELMRQRIAGRVLKAATLDREHGAPVTDVLQAITARLREVPPTGEHAWTERDLQMIATAVAKEFPVIAASKSDVGGASPRRPASHQANGRMRPNPVGEPSRAATLAFPPLQSYSPRARTQGLTATNTARAQPRVPKPPTEAVAANTARAAPGSSGTDGAPKLPNVQAPFAPDPTPPTPVSRQGRPKMLNAATVAAVDLQRYADDDGDDSPRAGSSQLRRRPPPDMWANMALADQQKWHAEQQDRQRRERETREMHRELLQQQVEEKRTVAQRERAEEVAKQRAAEAYLDAQAAKRREQDAKRKAQEAKVKDEIARQLEATAARKERQRMRELLADKKQKALYDKQLEEERANIAARRQAAFEVQQQSLQYNAAQKAAKEQEKAREAERDREAARIMEEQLAVAEARRQAQLAKIHSQTQRSQRMAASLQASFEQQQREQEERAEREAAALRAEAEAKAAQQWQKKWDSITQTQRELEEQMEQQRIARDAELAKERAMADRLRQEATQAQEEERVMRARRREQAAAHRRAVEAQIAEKERAHQQPGDLTRTERSMNRALLRETPALAATPA